MFGDFDCLTPLVNHNNGSDRAHTPQLQRSMTPTGSLKLGVENGQFRINSRDRRRQSNSVEARISASARVDEHPTSNRPSSRKKERQWENKNLIPVLTAGYKISSEADEEDIEGSYDVNGNYKVNFERMKLSINPKSMFAKLFQPENVKVLAEFRKCSDDHIHAMDSLSKGLDKLGINKKPIRSFQSSSSSSKK